MVPRMALEIRRCSVAEIEAQPPFGDLLALYAQECALAGMPPPKADMAMYHALETTGRFFVLGAFENHELIGFLAFFVTRIPHYGADVGTCESYFVAPDKRRTNAGVALRFAAEKLAKEHGALGLFFSAPTGARLSKILPASGYRHTNDVFFKALA